MRVDLSNGRAAAQTDAAGGHVVLFFCGAGLAILLGLLHAGAAQSQYRTRVAGYNPYTGRYVGGHGAYNPYTGTRGGTRADYNPYTATRAAFRGPTTRTRAGTPSVRGALAGRELRDWLLSVGPPRTTRRGL